MEEDKLLKIIEENNKMIKEFEQKLTWAYDEIKYLKEELTLNKSRENQREAKKNSTIKVEVAKGKDDKESEGLVSSSESYVDSRVIETLILESSKNNEEDKSSVRKIVQEYSNDEQVETKVDEVNKFEPLAIYEEGEFDVIEGIAVEVENGNVEQCDIMTEEREESESDMAIGEAISHIVVDSNIGEAISHIVEENVIEEETNQETEGKLVAEYEDEGFEIEIGEGISEINSLEDQEVKVESAIGEAISEVVSIEESEESIESEEQNDEQSVVTENEEITLNEEYKDAELIGELKNNFTNNNMDEVKIILDAIIDRISFIEEGLNEDDVLVIIYLGYFTNKLNELLACSNKVSSYYSKDSLELRILQMISDEKDYALNTASKECVYSVIKENEDNIFVNFHIILKGRIIQKVHSVAYKTFKEVSTVEKIQYGVKTNNIRAWVRQENDFLWMLVDGLYSEEEDILYMLESAIIILKLKKNNKVSDIKEVKEPVLEKEVEINIATADEIVVENIVVEKKPKLGEKMKSIFHRKK